MLWTLPLVIVPTAFFASLPWLKTIAQPLAILITTAAMIFILGYSNYLGYRALRGLDEVQKVGAAFAAQWGAPAGQAAFALLLVLPPFKDFAAGLVNRLATGPETTVDGAAIGVALSLGFCTVLLLQAVGTVIVQSIWWTVKR